LNKKSL